MNIPPLDLAKLKSEAKEFIPAPFSETAQPMSVVGQSRFGMLAPSEKPGLLVSARSIDQLDGVIPLSAQYRTGIHLYFYDEIPNNRFRFKFYKNRFGRGVINIPVMKNLLEYLGDWCYEENGMSQYITTDIVGMIYVKTHFP